MDYYYISDGKKIGPLKLDELKTKDLKSDTLVWHEGIINWTKAEKIEVLVDLFIKSPPPIPPPPIPVSIKKTISKDKVNSSRKNKSISKKIKYIFYISIILIISFLTLSLRFNKKCISGDCKNGFGVAIYHKDDHKNSFSGLRLLDINIFSRIVESVYVGEFKNGMREGKGASLKYMCDFSLGSWKNDEYKTDIEDLSLCGYSSSKKEVKDILNFFMKIGRLNEIGQIDNSFPKIELSAKKLLSSSRTRFGEKHNNLFKILTGTLANSLEPRNYDAIMQLACTYYRSKAYDMAVYYFEKGFEINDSDGVMRFFSGESHENLKEYDRAYFDYNKAISLSSFPDGEYFYRRGVANKLSSIKKHFCNDFKKACDLGIDQACSEYKKCKRYR